MTYNVFGGMLSLTQSIIAYFKAYVTSLVRFVIFVWTGSET